MKQDVIEILKKNWKAIEISKVKLSHGYLKFCQYLIYFQAAIYDSDKFPTRNNISG